tara:strand:+ start:1230 stop:1460 length:231 start_codon:yes stop_codon:yes gene_type:complete
MKIYNNKLDAIEYINSIKLSDTKYSTIEALNAFKEIKINLIKDKGLCRIYDTILIVDEYSLDEDIDAIWINTYKEV